MRQRRGDALLGQRRRPRHRRRHQLQADRPGQAQGGSRRNHGRVHGRRRQQPSGGAAPRVLRHRLYRRGRRGVASDSRHLGRLHPRAAQAHRPPDPQRGAPAARQPRGSRRLHRHRRRLLRPPAPPHRRLAPLRGRRRRSRTQVGVQLDPRRHRHQHRPRRPPHREPPGVPQHRRWRFGDDLPTIRRLLGSFLLVAIKPNA